MPHVVTQACCGDAACVYACPVNCIHPTPEEPDFGISEMLYIDPSTCVDCGACVSACPVGAIVPGHRLTDGQLRFVDINAAQYGGPIRSGEVSMPGSGARFPVDPGRRLPLAPIDKPRPIAVDDTLSVAIVGSGPSAMYAADELLRQPRVRVTIYERLDRPFGLARYGVAPDHTETRTVMRYFDTIATNPHIEIRLGVTVGRDVTLEQLRESHDAVIWAGGAPTDRPLPVPHAYAAGVLSATSVVGWYNDHPDFTSVPVDLVTDRVAIIGNGNVALDVARILTTHPDKLARTDIAPHALAALRRSAVSEVVVVGRRGPQHAAFTLPELVGLVDGGANVVVDPADLEGAHANAGDVTTALKLELLREVATRTPADGPRIRLAFWEAPAGIVVDRDGYATGVELARNAPTDDGGVAPTGATGVLDAGLILTSIGYRGKPVPGLPFDDAAGVVPHAAGRVLDGDAPMPGVYVTGWIKRGPTGFIGTNKTDSTETVMSLLADAESGVLPSHRRSSRRRGRLLARLR